MVCQHYSFSDSHLVCIVKTEKRKQKEKKKFPWGSGAVHVIFVKLVAFCLLSQRFKSFINRAFRKCYRSLQHINYCCLPQAASSPQSRGRASDDRMACSKRRKVNEENVYFFGTEKFIFILVVSISMPHIPHIRHYETKHTFFEQSYLMKSKLRARNINLLQSQYDRQPDLSCIYLQHSNEQNNEH